MKVSNWSTAQGIIAEAVAQRQGAQDYRNDFDDTVTIALGTPTARARELVSFCARIHKIKNAGLDYWWMPYNPVDVGRRFGHQSDRNFATMLSHNITIIIDDFVGQWRKDQASFQSNLRTFYGERSFQEFTVRHPCEQPIQVSDGWSFVPRQVALILVGCLADIEPDEIYQWIYRLPTSGDERIDALTSLFYLEDVVGALPIMLDVMLDWERREAEYEAKRKKIDTPYR